jgi:hypothetical protein
MRLLMSHTAVDYATIPTGEIATVVKLIESKVIVFR